MKPQGDGRFPTTHWMLIARLRSPDEAIARKALDELCAQYHFPLYCAIRHRGLAHHDAEDALHDFLAKLLRLEAFAGADAEKGRLRAFLGTALTRFLGNWHRDQCRPRAREMSMDAMPGGDASPDHASKAEARYRASLIASGRANSSPTFSPASAPITRSGGKTPSSQRSRPCCKAVAACGEGTPRPSQPPSA